MIGDQVFFDGQTFTQIWPDDFELIYFGEVHDWSWGDYTMIFQKGDKFYENDDFDQWGPAEITLEEALQRLEDFGD